MKNNNYEYYQIKDGYVTKTGDIFYKGEIIGHCDPTVVSFHDYVIDTLEKYNILWEPYIPEDDIDWEGLDRLLRTNNNLILEEYLQFESLVILMDDEIREKLHREIAPCSNEEFLKRY